MRILHLVEHLIPGGLEVMALDLAEQSANNHSVLVIALSGNKTDASHHWNRLSSLAIDVVFCDKASHGLLATLNTLRKHISDFAPNVIHSHHIGPLLYSTLARLTLRKTIAHIHTEHDAWHLQNPKHLFLFRSLTFIGRPSVIACGPQVLSILKTLAPSCRATLICNGINTEQFTPGPKTNARQQLDLPVKAEIIGSAGRLETVKGMDILIEAFAKLTNKHIYLAIAGNGSQLAALNSLIASLNLSNRIFLLGNVDNMPMFYQALDYYCQPSRNEGLPLAPLEAQSSGLPVALNGYPDASFILPPASRDGCVAKRIEADALASALEAMLHTTARDNREWVEKQFSLSTMTQQYEASYSQLVSEK